MKEQQNLVELIPEEIYEILEWHYTLLNLQLFDGELNKCHFSISRISHSLSYCEPYKWMVKNKKNTARHEIVLTLKALRFNTEKFCALLVHQMCHLWQHQVGKPSRSGYHNKQWASKMLSLGLLPTDNGRRNGKSTGQSVTEMIIEDGRFVKLFNDYQHKLCELNLVLTSFAIHQMRQRKPKDGKSKKAYRCHQCGLVVWGKEGLDLICKSCNRTLKI